MLSMAKKMGKTDKKIQKRSQAEDEEVEELAALILAEAGKMAKLRVRRAAEQVLLEATALARWTKRPFYVA